MTPVPKPPMTIKQRERLQSKPRLVDRSGRHPRLPVYRYPRGDTGAAPDSQRAGALRRRMEPMTADPVQRETPTAAELRIAYNTGRSHGYDDGFRAASQERPSIDVERTIWRLIESYEGTIEIDTVQRFREHIRSRLSGPVGESGNGDD